MFNLVKILGVVGQILEATNSSELPKVELLNDVLKSKYNLERTIQKI